MMRCRARFHADKARRKLVEERDDLYAPQLPSENYFFVPVNAVDLKKHSSRYRYRSCEPAWERLLWLDCTETITIS